MRAHFLRAVQKGGYDADAQALFDARAGVSDEPTAAYKQAISDYVTALKAVSGLWAGITQLVVIAGATTVAGARLSIKGNNLTNSNFVDADINTKTGSLGNGTNKHWATGYTLSGRQNSHHAYAYYSSLPTTFSPAAALFGSGGSAAGMNCTFASASSVVYRSSNATSSSLTPGGVGGYGVNRTSSANYQRLNAGTTSTVTLTSGSPNTSDILVQARTGSTNIVETRANGRMLVWAFGDGITTLADYNTPTSNLITALNAI